MHEKLNTDQQIRGILTPVIIPINITYTMVVITTPTSFKSIFLEFSRKAPNIQKYLP